MAERFGGPLKASEEVGGSSPSLRAMRSRCFGGTSSVMSWKERVRFLPVALTVFSCIAFSFRIEGGRALGVTNYVTAGAEQNAFSQFLLDEFPCAMQLSSDRKAFVFKMVELEGCRVFVPTAVSAASAEKCDCLQLGSVPSDHCFAGRASPTFGAFTWPFADHALTSSVLYAVANRVGVVHSERRATKTKLSGTENPGLAVNQRSVWEADFAVVAGWHAA